MSLNRNNLDAAMRALVLEVAQELADIARAETLHWFRHPSLTTHNKLRDGFDPVTEADQRTEAAIRAHLAARRPEDGILGEEHGMSASTSGLTWIIDPIDGTRGFIAGTPCWTVLIALADAEGAFLGVIDQPFIGERFVGGLGEAWSTGPLGHRTLAARMTPFLSEAVLSTTFPEIGTEQERVAFERVQTQVRLTRYGMDGYAYALLAAGQIDLVIEAGLHPYDIAAPLAVIEAAGGVMTDWSGAPVGATRQVLAAANPALHAQALALLNA